MKPIFPKGIDALKPVIFLTALVSIVSIALIVNFYFTDAHLSVGYKPDQPIPFSHRLHAGEMGMDCRYCHVNVEKSPHATVPSASVCMNCHKHVKKQSPSLTMLRERFEKYIEVDKIINDKSAKLNTVKVFSENDNFLKPIPWVRVHNIPDHAYFDHSAHINANVGCIECHGRIDKMTIVKQEKPLTMSWCLDCHQNYEEHVRPDNIRITDMDWKWTDETSAAAFKKKLIESKKLNPPKDCSACHR